MSKVEEIRDMLPVFTWWGGWKGISASLDIETTRVGDKYRVKYRPKGSNEPWKEHVATVYFERFTDRHVIDVGIKDDKYKEGDEFEVIITKEE